MTQPFCDPNPMARRGECVDPVTGQVRYYADQAMGIHIASNPQARYNTMRPEDIRNQWGTIESPDLQQSGHHQADGVQPDSPWPVQIPLPTVFGLDLSNPLVLVGVGFVIWYVWKGR